MLARAPTRYLANLAEDLSRQAAPTGWAKTSVKLGNLGRHISCRIGADRQAGRPAACSAEHLPAGCRNVQGERGVVLELVWPGESFNLLCRKCFESCYGSFCTGHQQFVPSFIWHIKDRRNTAGVFSSDSHWWKTLLGWKLGRVFSTWLLLGATLFNVDSSSFYSSFSSPWCWGSTIFNCLSIC